MQDYEKENKNNMEANDMSEAVEASVDYGIAAGQREQIYPQPDHVQQNSGYDTQQDDRSAQQNDEYSNAQQPINEYSNAQQQADEYDNAQQNNYYYDANSDYNRQQQSYGYGSGNNYDAYNNNYNNYNNNDYNNGYYNSSYGADSYNGGILQDQPMKKSGNKTGRRILAGAVAAAVCFGFGFGGGALAINLMGRNGSDLGSNTTISMDANTVSTLNAASAIAEKVLPSVVSIVTTEKVTQSTYFGTQSGTASGMGTGIVVSADGYILTNSHVIGDGQAISVTVSTYDGQEYDGKVLYYNTVLDLAIVKIEASGLTAAELGDSDTVNIGDYAVAIGNPMKMNYERSVSQGIISGLDRSVAATNSLTGTTNNMEGLIQTDAAINSGNSGGPLINSQGQVIGINTVKTGSAEGLGFAIPINSAVPIVQEIIQNGTYEDAYIGIRGISVSDILSEGYKLDANAQSGVYVRQIYTQSPASEAGLREGDIITAMDGETIESMTAIKQFMAKHKPGDTVSVTFERDKQTQTVNITLGKSDTSSNMVPSANESSDTDNGNNGGLFGDNGSNGLFGGNNGNNGYYYYYGY